MDIIKKLKENLREDWQEELMVFFCFACGYYFGDVNTRWILFVLFIMRYVDNMKNRKEKGE